MDHSTIIRSVSVYVPLEDVEILYFTSLLLPLKIRQGEFTERTGNISKGMIYVNTGCLMTYFSDKQATDHVIQFATAGWWTGDLHSFTSQILTLRKISESDL